MLSILWFVVVVLVILWVLGLAAFHLGYLVWLFLVAAIIVGLFSLSSRYP